MLYRSNARVQWDAVGDSASDFVGECAVGGCEGDEDKLAGVVQEASVSDLSPGPSRPIPGLQKCGHPPMKRKQIAWPRPGGEQLGRGGGGGSAKL